MPFGRVAAHRQADPGRSPLAPEHGGRELDRVARESLVARRGDGQDIVDEGRPERARHAGVDAVPREAEVEHVGAVAHGELGAAQQVALGEAAVAGRADGQDLRVAGHSLPAEAVAVDGCDQPTDERAVADEVGHVAAAGVGVIDTLDPARELGMARVEAGVEHGDRAARASACRGQGLARADVVEEPGELEVAVRGVGRVEGVGRDPHLGVALDVRHARIRAERAGEGRTGGHRRGHHGNRRKGLGPGAERPEHVRHTGDMPVRADSDEHMLRASAAGNPRQLARGAGGRPDVARLREGQRHDGAGPGRAGLDAQGVAQEPAIEKVLGCIRGRGQKRHRADHHREHRSSHRLSS